VRPLFRWLRKFRSVLQAKAGITRRSESLVCKSLVKQRVAPYQVDRDNACVQRVTGPNHQCLASAPPQTGAAVGSHEVLFIPPGFPALPMQLDRQGLGFIPKPEVIFDFIRVDHIVAAITACLRPIARPQTLELCAGRNFELKSVGHTRIRSQDLLVLSRCVRDARHGCLQELCCRGIPSVRWRTDFS
jgi:hypothetical protein